MPEERNIGMWEFACGDVSPVMVVKGYFDDSSDEKRRRFFASGGLVGGQVQWAVYEKSWNVATYELKRPFHSTDCEAGHGCCEGWERERRTALMKKLIGIVLNTHLMGLGSIVPIREYMRVFPQSDEYDPYFLSLKHVIVNMAYIGRMVGEELGFDSIKVCVETGTHTATAFRIYSAFKALPNWSDGKYLGGFECGDKRLTGLQGADLIAREAFKHADNISKLQTRKSVKAMQHRLSFHLWTRECLEYLKDNGGPDNLEVLTSWPYQGGDRPPMTNFYGSTF